jgi:hypothetical protein
MNKFSLNNPIFREKRLLNFSEKPEGKEAAGEAPNKKVLDMLSKIHKVSPLVEGKGGVEKVLKNNPFAHLLTPIAESVEGKNFTVDLSKLKDGEYTLVVGGKKIVIDKLAFVALQWPAIDRKLTEHFKGKNITKRLIAHGIEKKSAPLKALLLEIALDPAFADPKVIEAARVALDKLRPSLSPATTRSRIKMKGKVDRTKAKPVVLPTKFPKKESNKTFIKTFNSRKNNPKHKLDKLKMNILREGNQINAQKWSHTSEAGLAKIHRDFETVGISVNSPFYQSMFHILRQATDPKVNKYLRDKDYQRYFLDPANNMPKLEGLSDLPTGFSPSAFAKAYQHLQYVQGMLLAQDKWQKDTLGKQESQDSNSIARKVTDGIRANYNKFASAIKTRDYATAGLYCVLIWGAYKAAKESGWFGKGGKGTKYLAYALAGSAAVIFAKNAGYDILKMAGFRDKNYEVKGTPLEAIANILKANPQHKELAKDLDYGIVLQASNVPLRDLEELFQKSNKEGIQFIHPNQFPKIFPELSKEWSFKMGIGRNPMGGDYAGMAKSKLTSQQREYIRVGQQLYKVALAMRAVYDDTLKKDHPEYQGKAYEKMLLDPTVNPGKVRHLLAAVCDYAPSRPRRRLTSTKSIDEANVHLKALKKFGLDIQRQVGKSGHFNAKLMGYPVVFVRVGDAYRVYLKSDYGSELKPGVNVLAVIPIADGPRKTLGLKNAVDGVTRRMEELLAPLQGAGNQNFDKPKWVNGKWVCKVTLPGAAEYDIRSRKTKAFITVHENGKGLYIETEGGVAIVLNELVAKEYPAALALVPAVCAQKEFSALKAFAAINQIQFRDRTPGDKKFTLLIGDRKLPLGFTYDKTTKKFTVNSADEKKMLEDPAFAVGYVAALQKNPTFTLNKTAKGLREAINAAPENILSFLWNQVTGQTRDPQNDGINIDFMSGSVPDYVSNAIVDTGIYESMQRLRRAVTGATSFSDVSKSTTDQLHDTNAKMQGILSMLRSENRKKSMSKWKREEWMTRVVMPLRASSSISSRYVQEKAQFEYKMYQMMGPMRSDLAKSPHRKAADLVNVYTYYTAHLDDHEFTYKDSTGAVKKATVRLDAMTSPKPTGVTPRDTDPGLRGFYITNYLRYVQDKIYNKTKNMDSLDHIPDGTATDHWDILEFDRWVESEGTSTPLDPIDNKLPITHDAATKHAAGKFTELEKRIAAEFDKAVALLMAECPDLNYHAVHEYLRKNQTTGTPTTQVGVFRIVTRNRGGVATDNCVLWDWAGPIARAGSRSKQLAQIQKLVDKKLIRHIFERPNKFFIKPPGRMTRIRRRWPWLVKYGI